MTLLWQADPDAETGSTSRTSLTITAPSSGVSETDQVLLLVNGVTPVPTGVTVSGSGISQATLVEPTAVANEWWAAYALTGVSNSQVITVAVGASAKFYDMLMVGYSGSAIGNVSANFARPSNSNLSTLPAFTLLDADSTVVDLWAERNTAGATSLAVNTGTLRRQFKGSGTTTGHIAVSDYEPGSTSAGAVVGTYTNGAGTNRNSTNGAGLQVELLPGIGPVTPAGVTSIAAGGIDTTSARIRMDVTNVVSGATVIAATDTALTTDMVETSSAMPDADGLLIHDVSGLIPHTDYFYGVRLDGVVKPARGTFRTASTAPQQSFSFLAASCVGTAADPVLFNFMRARTGPTGKTADFFVHLGDLEYLDLSSADATDYIDAFRGAFAKTNQQALFTAMQLEYTLSDHDFWGPNCDAETAAAGVVDAWRDAFARYFPTYDLPASDGGIFRSWVRGRVRFILTDGRTYMSDITATDDASKTKLGAEQKAWWKEECLAAHDAEQVIIWLHEDAWDPTPAFVGDDSWAAYATERTELAGYLTSNGIDKIMIIHGDYHALAADDGANSPGDIPIACVAPMSQSYFLASQSHWSEGSYPPSGTVGTLNQYGWFDVIDDDSSLTVNFTGYSNDGTADTARISLTTTWPMTRAVPTTLSGSGTLTVTGLIASRAISATLPGAANLSADALASRAITSASNASGSLTANLGKSSSIASTLNGSGSLTANLGKSRPIIASLNGSGSLTANLGKSRAIVVLLSGSGNLTVLDEVHALQALIVTGVTGPKLVAAVTGPKVKTPPKPSGPAVTEKVTGPELSTTVTGPGV